MRSTDRAALQIDQPDPQGVEIYESRTKPPVDKTQCYVQHVRFEGYVRRGLCPGWAKKVQGVLSAGGYVRIPRSICVLEMIGCLNGV